ncbi:MAG: hypothetical protein JW839_22130 [Candidatus Lokiarchaeota archaeon]|nr:hypothetical protein [Candidatus Lokiarchaeota archaeon]
MTAPTTNKARSFVTALQTRVFPPVALASVATFGWAIRGQAGFGAIPGCVFAGTLIACTWYFWSTRAARDGQARPYSSGWTLLALILGIGIEGMHGWSQYGTWIQGKFWVGQDVYWELNPLVGYAWLFVAAVPWGATGAVFLAWTRRGDHLPGRLWGIRIAFGGTGFLGAFVLFFALRRVILPYWGVAPYDDFAAWEGCMDTYFQVLQGMLFMGLFLGFLAFEVWRKHWQNVKLIGIVALITGVGWLVAKTWMFADEAFPGLGWNWWRCWEASAGLAIGLGYAVAFVACNRPRGTRNEQDLAAPVSTYHRWQDVFERYVGLYLALIIGLVYALSSLIKGMFAIYDDEDLATAYRAIAGVMLGGGLGLPVLASLARQLRGGGDVDPAGDRAAFGRLYPVIVSALFIVGLLVTGPITSQSERAFICFYVVLWAITFAMIPAAMVFPPRPTSSRNLATFTP